MNIRASIIEETKLIAADHNMELVEIHDLLPILECGLDSLSVAVLSVRIEDVLGFDIFADHDIPVTFGELFALCERESRKRNIHPVPDKLVA